MPEGERPWWDGRRREGFRLSASDVGVIVLSAAATWGLWGVIGEQAWVIGLVVGHFFLFCNVFRAARKAELLWAGVLVVNSGVWLAAGGLTVERVFLCQLPVTAAVVLWTILRRDYRGIGYSHIRRARSRAEGGAS